MCPQWQDAEKVSLPFVLYRFLAFVYFWGFFIYDLLKDRPNGLGFYMIYLTNWTYLSVIADIGLQLMSALAAAYRCRKGKNSNNNSSYRHVSRPHSINSRVDLFDSESMSVCSESRPARINQRQCMHNYWNCSTL